MAHRNARLTPITRLELVGEVAAGWTQAEVARRFRECGGVLAVTSANRHGEPPATSTAEVVAVFGDALLVLDGGPRTGGAASTVVDLTVEPPAIIREGPVSAADLGLVVGEGE